MKKMYFRVWQIIWKILDNLNMISEIGYSEGMRPLVSVIIPTYNSGVFLKEAVESALDQDYPNLEVVVVDDGSTDDSLSLLTKYFDRIQIVKSQNFGAASARNLGILASSGEYLAFLDSDDKWIQNKISLQIKKMFDEKLDLVYCAGQEFSTRGSVGKIHEPVFQGDCYQYYKKYPSRDVVAIGPSGVVLKKSIMHKSGIFDTKIPAPSEDWDFFRRYSQHAKFGYCTDVLVLRRIHENNISRKSILGYYLGNRNALLKMFLDDPQIGAIERRIIWVKFNYMSTKAFAKRGEILRSFWALSQIFLPRYL
jgi:glycosyltransferase involved in cell wall biosynthesis